MTNILKFYNKILFPFLMNKNLKKEAIKQYRIEVLKNVSNKILEIGYGTGLNVECYPEQIKKITAIDRFITGMVLSNVNVELYEMSVTNMSFESNSFDTVVSTFTLCSIGDLEQALSEIKRVLKPGGKFIFLEHGKSDNKVVASLQNIVNPLFNIFACGCNVNRNFEEIISESGFKLLQCNRIRMKSRPITGFMYSGIAINRR